MGAQELTLGAGPIRVNDTLNNGAGRNCSFGASPVPINRDERVVVE